MSNNVRLSVRSVTLIYFLMRQYSINKISSLLKSFRHIDKIVNRDVLQRDRNVRQLLIKRNKVANGKIK